MAPKKKGKKEPSRLAGIFLDDPWRKCMALALGFAAWWLISDKITATKQLLFTVTDRVQTATGLYLEIPTPPGFTLWRINGRPLEGRPKVKITFEGPSQRVQRIPEILRLSIAGIDTLTRTNKTVQVGLGDLTIPKHPELESLLKELEGEKLELTFEHYLANRPFLLNRNTPHREIELQCNPENLPQGYTLDEELGITFDPQMVRLSGPKILIDNLTNYREPDHKREKLLESITILGGMQVKEDQEGNPVLVHAVELAPAWRRLEMWPRQVKALVHLKQQPGRIDSTDSLPVAIIGPEGDQWTPAHDPSRSVIVEVFDRDYWWRVVNQKQFYNEASKEDPRAQQDWIRAHIRLVATSADISPDSEPPVAIPIHPLLLPPAGEETPRVKILIEGRAKLRIRKKKTAEKKD
jgi:hypothetical protein